MLQCGHLDIGAAIFGLLDLCPFQRAELHQGHRRERASRFLCLSVLALEVRLDAFAF